MRLIRQRTLAAAAGPKGEINVKIKPGRRQLADSLLAAQGDGHPDHTIEGAFRDLLDAANRTLENRDPDRRILPISLVKVLVECYGTDIIAKTVQIADAIVATEKGRRPSLHVVK
jgi:hypothetical protein